MRPMPTVVALAGLAALVLLASACGGSTSPKVAAIDTTTTQSGLNHVDGHAQAFRGKADRDDECSCGVGPPPAERRGDEERSKSDRGKGGAGERQDAVSSRRSTRQCGGDAELSSS